MITATLQEAKAKLNHLVQAAEKGQDVVLMRGTKIVATLLPISEKDINLSPRLNDIQAARFWKWAKKQKGNSFKSAKAAEKFLESIQEG